MTGKPTRSVRIALDVLELARIEAVRRTGVEGRIVSVAEVVDSTLRVALSR